MTQEKILELLLLSHIETDFYHDVNDHITLYRKRYNHKEIRKRYIALMEEFLSPYVIDNNSKE